MSAISAARIHLVKGDATQPVGDGRKFVCHCCNDEGKWGRGFVLAISKRWPKAEGQYRKWFKSGDQFKLGEVQFVDVGDSIHVANLIGQQGVRSAGKKPPVRYDAIERGLITVAERAARLCASIHMPRMGCGLAGGQWPTVEAILQKTLVAKKIDVFVYEL